MPVERILINEQGNHYAENGANSLAARYLSSGGKVSSLRPVLFQGGILREDEWKVYDDAVIKVQVEEFSLIRDMIKSGMTKTIDKPLGTMSLNWDRVARMGEAQVSMLPDDPDKRENIGFLPDSMPLYLTHKGFQLDVRTLEASRSSKGKCGASSNIDTIHAEAATVSVIRKLEKMAIGQQFSVSNTTGGTAYGLTTYPHRKAYSIPTAWDSVSSSKNILDDVRAMLQIAANDNINGQMALYISPENETVLEDDYDTTTSHGRTIQGRLLELKRLKSIHINYFLPPGQMVLVQMKKSTVEIIDGLRPHMIQWQELGGFIFNYKVMAMMPLRIRRDAEDHCGIVHGVTA